MRGFVGRDEGFSLSELIVVTGLIGVVLAGAYAVAHAVVKGSSVNETQAMIAREAGQPLSMIQKYLMQATAIEETGPYRIRYIIDRELRDPEAERHVLEATSDGRLVLTMWPIDVAHTNTGPPRAAVLSERNTNVADGVPLLKYIDVTGAQVTSMEHAPSATRQLEATVRVRWDEQSHESSLFMSLRNRE
ncbi:MAG: prepilin-type N-terminal cleavage/methylation domain-containing protein [Coriobacteriia bacterium]|nr:prepilin-type N-terminal cleavage/methylation domain-containing protein [Coriobacteriia bacterium]